MQPARVHLSPFKAIIFEFALASLFKAEQLAVSSVPNLMQFGGSEACVSSVPNLMQFGGSEVCVRFRQ
jgi:hypothetical protein